jgi:hypothetical protein
MKRLADPTLVWGLALLAASGLMLLARLGAVPTAALFWTGVFTAVGGGFAYAFVVDSRRWWAAIPAGAVLGLAVVTAWTELAGRSDDVGGALFFGMVALGFWAVLARGARHWWALVPGGAATTLALVAALSPMTASEAGEAAVGAVFFLGLAATFLLVAATPAGGRRRWAYVPAAGLAGAGVLVALEALITPPVLEYLTPAALAVTGLVVLWRSLPHHHGRA